MTAESDAAPAAETPAHTHEQGIRLQTLPACLAPTDKALLAQPRLDLPRPGDLVILDAASVMWLERDKPNGPATRANTALRAVATSRDGSCQGAEWDYIFTNDPNEPGLEEGDAEAIAATWDLLIDQANQAQATAATS